MDFIQIIYQTVAKVVHYFRTNVQKRRKSIFFSNAAPADYIRAKHTKDFDKFVSEIPEAGKEIWKFDNGCVSYTYEFNEL